MIKPQELRIGNHLNAVVSNGVETLNFHELIVNEIKADGIREEKGIIFPYENLVGTPLTEEWLIKFGFDKSSDNEHWFIGHHGFCLTYDGNDWCLKSRLDEPYVILYIRTVHKMQNVFYYLTGEELTLK